MDHITHNLTNLKFDLAQINVTFSYISPRTMITEDILKSLTVANTSHSTTNSIDYQQYLFIYMY